MRLMPRHVVLGVIWRLLLLAGAVAGVLAIGIHEYGWQPIGLKAMPAAPTEPGGMVVRQEMPEDASWAEPEMDKAPPAAEPEAEPPKPPEAAPEKTPPPKPDKTPPPEKPKTIEKSADEQALEDLLNQDMGKKKKKK
jgi:outer membrane biosynthesis protein TonB